MINSKRLNIAVILLILPFAVQAQSVQDDFDGNGTITTWFGDNCSLDLNVSNPFKQGLNTSPNVLEYHDTGGQYANVRFDVESNYNLSTDHTFTLKIYVPSSGLTGNLPNQISLKLQDGKLGEPWGTQSEIIKSIELDQWQTITFDFKNDNYINLDNRSLPPVQRTDFNRVVIQVNGENNNEHVLAYLDDVSYDGTIEVSTVAEPVFDSLVWADEFNQNGAINADRWFHQTQLPPGGSWYNNEIQHYTNRLENSFVQSGVLHLVAQKETFTDQGSTKQYTSARLNSKFTFQYGRVEIRARLPFGVGTWPALWMLGKNINEDGGYWDIQGFGSTSWPACGEIDIMEHWGDNQNFVQSATHTPSSFGNTFNKGGQVIPTVSDNFHVYTLDWSEDRLVFSIDDVVHYTYNPGVKNANTWPFDHELYLLFNIAILPNIQSDFTQSSMEIDYVRIYQESGENEANEEEEEEEQEEQEEEEEEEEEEQNEVVTSIENVDREEYNVYPNPANDQLIIELGQTTSDKVKLNLYSLDGTIINTKTYKIVGGQVIINNLKALSPGFYFIQYQLEDRLQRLKFIKE